MRISKRSTTRAKAKFLETASNEAAAGMPDRIGQVVTEAIKRRLG
jgi:hypothetical protein